MINMDEKVLDNKSNEKVLDRKLGQRPKTIVYTNICVDRNPNTLKYRVRYMANGHRKVRSTFASHKEAEEFADNLWRSSGKEEESDLIACEDPCTVSPTKQLQAVMKRDIKNAGDPRYQIKMARAIQEIAIAALQTQQSINVINVKDVAMIFKNMSDVIDKHRDRSKMQEQIEELEKAMEIDKLKIKNALKQNNDDSPKPIKIVL